MKRRMVIVCDVEDSRFRSEKTLEAYIRGNILPALWASSEGLRCIDFTDVEFKFFESGAEVSVDVKEKKAEKEKKAK